VNDKLSKLQCQPQILWVGIGCRRGTSRQLIETAIQQVLKENQLKQSAIAGIATIDNKASEVGLVELCCLRNLPLKTFPAAVLRIVCVPNPGKISEQEIGTPSVAEASAILAASHVNWHLKMTNQRWEKTEQVPLHPSLNVKANSHHLTLSLAALEVKLLVPKQIFRLQEEPGAVTVAVAQSIKRIESINQLLSEHS
jgi:hypothetical protein